MAFWSASSARIRVVLWRVCARSGSPLHYFIRSSSERSYLPVCASHRQGLHVKHSCAVYGHPALTQAVAHEVLAGHDASHPVVVVNDHEVAQA